jgi:ParB family chromosome partitioning protein
VAAGGRIERDLFSEESDARWLDIALLERLAGEKLEEVAATTAAEIGIAFVRPTLDSWVSHSQTEGLRRVPLETQPLTDEESARVEALEGEIEDLVDLLQDDETAGQARDEAEARIRELSDRIAEITDKPPVIDEALKSQVGAFLLLDPEGRPRLDSSLYAQSAPAGGGSAEEDDGDGFADRSGEKAKAAGLSQRLVDELAMQRRDILAVHIAADPGLALDLAIFLMIDRDAGYSSEKSGSSLMAAAPSDPVFGFKTPGAAATIARAEATDALDRSWTEGATRSDRFDAFRALADEARAAWLGHAVARTLEASLLFPGQRACTFHDHLGQLLGIDVARWWRPTGANYFDRIPKALTLGALAEVGGPDLAGRYSRAKKAELAQACERIFSGDFIAEADVKQAALAWVPEVMRFAPSAALGDTRSAAEAAEDEAANQLSAEAGAGECEIEEAA